MASYTLKEIPPDIYERTLAAATDGCRSVNQEIIYRLKRSFDSEDARLTALHARWVAEALESGPARPLDLASLDAAAARGIAQAKARKAAAK